MDSTRYQRYRPKGRQGKHDRYWSLLLVGEHGKAVSLPKIKGIAVACAALLVLSLAALIILGFLYIDQTTQITSLKEQLSKAHQLKADLRDQKDVLLAKLVSSGNTPALHTEKEKSITQGKLKEASQDSPKNKADPTAEAVSAKNKVLQQKKTVREAIAEPKKPAVKWKADIRMFSVEYEPGDSILRAKYRIYNTSKPKKALSGRTVAVFKAQKDAAPADWISAPRVKLKQGVPDGKNGRIFKINNFRTMKLAAYSVKPPVMYDTACIYIFTDSGELIYNKQFDIQIDFQQSELAEIPSLEKTLKRESEPVTEKIETSQPLFKSQPFSSIMINRAEGEAADNPN
ncbi:MAG: hypothetical protein GY874_05115 [Desulfobacteraceae bacterium]|nr:hypothetical protein [Desulfobacteraceae bacterium]